MARPNTTPIRAGEEPALHACAFAIQGGDPVAATDLVFVDAQPRVERRLFLSVEPLEPSARGLELAALARQTLREVFEAADLPPAAALMKAFTAANAVLINENRPLAGCRWERRVYVGATGVVVAGTDLYLAQVPPTAAMIVQDQQLYAFPELASWRDDYAFPHDTAEPEPLGCREGLRPYLYRSTARPGDLLILCATALARQLGRGSDDAAEPLLAGDPDAALDCLASLAVTHELDDAHAAVVLLRRLNRERGPRRLTRPARQRATTAWTPAGATAATMIAARPARPGAAPFAVRIDWGGVGIPLDRPLVSDVASAPIPAGGASPSALAPRWLASALTRNLPPRDPAPAAAPAKPEPAALPPLRGASGARVMRRYREEASLPLEWHAFLPRGVSLRLPSRLLALGVVAIVAFGSSGALFDHYRTRIARADAALAAVDGSLQAIPVDPHAAPAALAAAETALAAARAAGADGTVLLQQTYAVEAARDQVPGNLRLRNVTRLGALPTRLAGEPVALVRAGADLWLVNDSLYGVDTAAGRLVEVLTPGEPVQGGDVGRLVAAAADDGALAVLDEHALFSLDGTGRWVRSYLAPDTAPRSDAPVATFQGSLYVLDPQRGLLKYDAADLAAPPTLWADAATYPDLLAGQDLVIDGQIHVLLRDGQVLTLLRHQLTDVRVADVSPPVTAPSQLVGGADAVVYIVEPTAKVGLTTGRIIRLDGSGNAVQLLPPLPAPSHLATDPAANALAGARDVVIDEARGEVYFITATDLWRAELPF